MTERAGVGALRWAGRAGLAALLAAGLTVQAVGIAASWGGGYWIFDVAVGAVAGTAAVCRHRSRTVAAAVGLAAATLAVPVALVAGLPREPSPTLALALAVLVGAAVRALPPRRATGVAAAGFAVAAGSWSAALVVAPGGTNLVLLDGVGFLAAVAGGLLLRLLDLRRRAVAEQVRRDERLALARELHDVVAHHVTGIVLHTQAARLVGADGERLDEALARIETAGADALTAMRRVLGLLRDDRDAGEADPMPVGVAQLRTLVGRFGAHGPAVRLVLPDAEPGWPAEVSSTVYRLVQEALTNVARHAVQPAEVVVRVTEDGPHLTVTVTDDGAPGRPRRRPGGYGLLGMRERIEALGGTLRAGPRPDAGWSVVATVPVPAGEPG
ncbi:sensor histidine kinase [Actinocatenispora thailandica]|uniref:sensor histidine kinase n=1 Tax=Actinocatenispora thailandica TaxID=227318 RepID=UPI001EF393EB|nr:histidine kinase [Actinocatenispora thailandica]